MVLAIIIFSIIPAVAVGIYLGSRGNTDTVRPGENQKTDECKEACTQWQTRKAELCDAERAETDAKERLDTLEKLLIAVAAGTISIVVALVGAAGAVSSLSALGIPAVIVAILLSAGISLALLGSVVTIALAAASFTAWHIWIEKQQASYAAETAETEARTFLNNACSQDEISTCLGNSPC